MHTITVRPVTRSDCSAIAEIEQQVFGSRGMPAASLDTVNRWYEQKSPFFLAAEYDCALCGYYYGIQIEFSPERPESFMHRDSIRELGYSDIPHQKTGTSLYGISMASLLPGKGGAGAALNTEVRKMVVLAHVQYVVGLSRLSRFGQFLKQQSVPASPSNLEQALLWYAAENARVLDMRTWLPKPVVAFPALTQSDPILAFHRLGFPFQLAAVFTNLFEDPESRDCGALLVSCYPHQP